VILTLCSVWAGNLGRREKCAKPVTRPPAADWIRSYHRSVSKPRDELAHALTLGNETERKLAVVSLIDEQVQRIEWRAIVIGGLAVEFWTHGAYSTSDIDLYLPHGPAVDDMLAELGFRKQGRHWVLPEHELFVEAPASFPAEEEEMVDVELASGRSVRVLSAEDVVIDRLHQFVAGGHADVAEQGVALLGIEKLDYPRLIERAKSEGLENALVELEQIALRVGRGEQIPSSELHEIAKRLQAQP
jgi:hypothetical protein